MILVEFLFPQKRFKLNHESADRELKVDAVDSLSLYNLYYCSYKMCADQLIWRGRGVESNCLCGGGCLKYVFVG